MDYLLISVITLGILSLLDVITAAMALRIPDVYEANPIVRGITGKSFENNSVS